MEVTQKINDPLMVSEKVKVLVAQLCLTLFEPMDYSLPGSSVHGILQARILELIAILSSMGLSELGIQPEYSSLQMYSLLSESPGKPHLWLRNI